MAPAQLTLVPDTCDHFDSTEIGDDLYESKPRLSIPLPSVVGDWRIHRHVGRGSTANVFSVRCGRLIAVMKVERVGATRSARSCIHREADWLRVHGGFGRPSLLDDGRLEDGRAWFVMSMAPGTNLSDWWQNGGKKTPLDSIRIIARAARIMGDVHRGGWVHRDLKPSNISIGPDGEVTILDWGLVHLNRPGVQSTTVVAGTPGFIPPELFRQRRPVHTPTLDTYALGCCLLVLLSGKCMWPHELGVQSIHTVVNRAGFTGIAKHSLVHILGRALSRDPRKRWQNGHELAAECEGWLRCMAPEFHRQKRGLEEQAYRTPA
ncbi:MAG: hypothetical protein CL927_19725 [Deltaproteobacteria bacterium]|nr:hypothetical protein [Deltaproteobacteria bacterium]HCH62148.1 hypothetical protein [Deltaproteobacteria bacterium]